MAFIKPASYNTYNSSLPDRGKDYVSRWDVLVLTMRISRVLGLAPVSIQRTRRGYTASISSPVQNYSYLFLGIIHVSVLTGLAFDLLVDSTRQVRTRTPTARFAWIAELVLVSSAVSVGVIGAKYRLEKSIHYLNIIDRIISQMGSQMPCNRRNYVGTVIYILSVIVLHIADFTAFAVEAVEKDKEIKVLCLYFCFYFELVMLVLLEVQFMWFALYIESGLKVLNKAFEDFVNTIDLRKATAIDLTFQPEGNTNNSNLKGSPSVLLSVESYTNIPIKSVNGYIDRISSQFDPGPNVLKGSTEMFDQLVASYSAILDVIRGMNDVYGPLLVLFLMSFILHFVVTPFYFVTFLTSQHKRMFNLTLQIVFCVYHFTYMLTVIEPGHLTEVQLEYTQMLTGRLAQRMTPRGFLAKELDLFAKLFLLNKASYTPMKMFTLTRALIPTVIGGVTTYLVIILQFQQLDINNW